MSSTSYSYIKFLEEPLVVDLISSGDIERIVQELGKAELGENFDYLVLPMLLYILKQKGIGANLGGSVEKVGVNARVILRLYSSANEFTKRSFSFLILGFDKYSKNRNPLMYTHFDLLELATRNRWPEHSFISPFIDSKGKWKFGDYWNQGL